MDAAPQSARVAHFPSIDEDHQVCLTEHSLSPRLVAESPFAEADIREAALMSSGAATAQSILAAVVKQVTAGHVSPGMQLRVGQQAEYPLPSNSCSQFSGLPVTSNARLSAPAIMKQVDKQPHSPPASPQVVTKRATRVAAQPAVIPLVEGVNYTRPSCSTTASSQLLLSSSDARKVPPLQLQQADGRTVVTAAPVREATSGGGVPVVAAMSPATPLSPRLVASHWVVDPKTPHLHPSPRRRETTAESHISCSSPRLIRQGMASPRPPPPVAVGIASPAPPGEQTADRGCFAWLPPADQRRGTSPSKEELHPAMAKTMASGTASTESPRQTKSTRSQSKEARVHLLSRQQQRHPAGHHQESRRVSQQSHTPILHPSPSAPASSKEQDAMPIAEVPTAAVKELREEIKLFHSRHNAALTQEAGYLRIECAQRVEAEQQARAMEMAEFRVALTALATLVEQLVTAQTVRVDDLSSRLQEVVDANGGQKEAMQKVRVDDLTIRFQELSEEVSKQKEAMQNFRSLMVESVPPPRDDDAIFKKLWNRVQEELSRELSAAFEIFRAELLSDVETALGERAAGLEAMAVIEGDTGGGVTEYRPRGQTLETMQPLPLETLQSSPSSARQTTRRWRSREPPSSRGQDSRERSIASAGLE